MDNTGKAIFPFKSRLNFRQLIEHWEQRVSEGQFPAFSETILTYIKNAPELKEPIENDAVFLKHKPFLDFLMTAAVPSATSETDLIAVMPPFQFKMLYSTPAMKRAVDFSVFEQQAHANVPGGKVTLGKTIRACLMILEKFQNFGMIAENPRPVLVTLTDPKTKLDKVYKIEITHQFCDIVCKTEYTPIDRSVIKFLMEKLYDADLWLQYIRPEDFEFQGLMIIRLVDVTEQEMLSAIKYDLLERSAVVRKESFEQIQHKIRSLFGINDIRLGIAYLDPNDNIIVNKPTHDSWNSVTAGLDDGSCHDYTGSVYERSWMEKRHITVENLAEYPFKSSVEETLLAHGIKNILLAPLIDNDEIIGMLELASPTPGKLNPISAHKLENAIPMFTAAVKRVKEEMSTEVRALIQEECTAIHPTVQWRFFEAGLNLLNRRRDDEKATLEEIAFKDVYPLYGLADVRNSSIERNTAIQRDLQQNLKLAKDLLHKIHEAKKLPLLDEVIFKTDEQLQKINAGLASGDESNVLDFLKSEINPMIDHFAGEEDLKKLIARYRAHLDPTFGVVYKRRKAFEESLALINTTISSYLDEAESEAQKMFPHYFEKYKTDGVEFTIYLGSSLVKDKTFDIFGLKNFRLWQLLVMIEACRRIETLKTKMKTPLEITQLILVHDQPISIRFRPDEKQFDVDGAYDIRYEIVKKRIDKAHIKNTGERLTQPGKLAIVYNQTKIEDEYKRYFHYLAAKGFITSNVEELELEELPGANGLRALRVQVINDQRPSVAAEPDDLLKEIEEGLRIH
ncbi:MAG TPA: GAF domain-containing protein [Ohtaekwangia sp.]|uniref:GAF domain-containing protein n=1 Tax=Ohtaekwangia sp. TaxID=2066019 RepID=UPI002F9361EE